MLRRTANFAAASPDEAPAYADIIRRCWGKSKHYFGNVGTRGVPFDSRPYALYASHVLASVNHSAKEWERGADLDCFVADVET